MRLAHIFLSVLLSTTLSALGCSPEQRCSENRFASLVQARNWTDLESYLNVERKKLATDRKRAFDKNLMLFFDNVFRRVEEQKDSCRGLLQHAQRRWERTQRVGQLLYQHKLDKLSEAWQRYERCAQEEERVKEECRQIVNMHEARIQDAYQAWIDLGVEFYYFEQNNKDIRLYYNMVSDGFSNDVFSAVLPESLTSVLREEIKTCRKWDNSPTPQNDEALAYFRYTLRQFAERWDAANQNQTMARAEGTSEIESAQADCAVYAEETTKAKNEIVLIKSACESQIKRHEKWQAERLLEGLYCGAMCAQLDKDWLALQRMRLQFQVLIKDGKR
jgi:hypothetical protein